MVLCMVTSFTGSLQLSLLYFCTLQDYTQKDRNILSFLMCPVMPVAV